MSTLSSPSPKNASIRIGIDVGGSAVKAGVVDVASGEVFGERLSSPTPQPATPQAVAELVGELVEELLGTAAGLKIGPSSWEEQGLRIGVALPTVVKQQQAWTAANIHDSWIGVSLPELFGAHASPQTSSQQDDSLQWVFLNDADAAGLAEFSSVSGPELPGHLGSSLFLTFGTGIGSALFRGGRLYPNTELGHLPFPLPGGAGVTKAEAWASAAVKSREGLSYPEWAARVSEVLNLYIALLHPEEIIVGGGISKESGLWLPLLTLDDPAVRIRAARHLNDAGVVGAALAASSNLRP